MEQEAWRILIVEDDRRLAELTREYLEGNGLKVDIEANGALAAARIRALLRRSEAPEAGAPAADSKRLAFGRLVIDNAMREAWLDGTTIELTSAEFDLLWLLAANAGRILSREEIFNALRGIEYDGQDRSIDVRISRIRPKIGDDPMHPRLIKTVRSKGYLFVGEG
ncbi:winged helix-turn-helix domain-containing protein [Pseudomonas aeruginosa]|uniref:winged helix-turn-helix domain-containing protein n=1 Tax=Pseudomonas aeruginosa TaxID=287 RepID=UPI002B27BE92|nr:winged helix-turn-helix domain-containing protein [Pseudomonas aeruginosa]MEA8538001.1 winged helix-turn-helix domain-containing protein [Pseudomonas aeruginosa]